MRHRLTPEQQEKVVQALFSDFFSFRPPHRIDIIKPEDVHEARSHVFDEDLHDVLELRFKS
jgi:hypothetical protein